MMPQWIIEKKRDGETLTPEEWAFFIEGYTDGRIPDYQMAALAMAIYFQGLSLDETATLTDLMLRSGDQVDTSSIPLPKIDKHSTGGVGDKVSLILAPLVACAGVAVPMISGRGLGITGGTLDKMQSIPGYRVDLTEDEFVQVVRECGCSIIGQTGRLAPADKKLYALRDVTATVPSIPLITASIMSKKLAEGIDGLVMDVKWGHGAFMKTLEDAEQLARTIVEVGTRMDKGMVALITGMHQPLGRTAGNALEVIESAEALQGRGADDLMEVTLALCAEMLLLAGTVDSPEAGIAELRKHLVSGAAFERFQKMVALHGGDSKALTDYGRLPVAELLEPLPAPDTGYVTAVNADQIGRAVILLGGGRSKTDDPIDHAVGIADLVKIGDRITRGEPLLTVHANDPQRRDAALEQLAAAVTVSSDPEAIPSLIVKTIRPATQGAS